MSDVVIRGLADSVIEPSFESKLRDTDKIKQILTDTVSVRIAS